MRKWHNSWATASPFEPLLSLLTSSCLHRHPMTTPFGFGITRQGENYRGSKVTKSPFGLLHSHTTAGYSLQHPTTKLLFSGTQLAKFGGYESSVVAVSFCRNDELLASASDDNTMRLWNVVSRNSVVLQNGGSWKFTVFMFFLLLPCTILINISSPLYEGDVRGGLIWELIFLVIFLLSFSRIIWYATEEPPLRRKLGLLGGRRRADKQALGRDRLAVMFFVTFVLSIVFCILWYQFRYDPTGTYKPGWTNVLG